MEIGVNLKKNHNGFNSVVIEAGHIYVDEGIQQHHIDGVVLGSKIAHAFSSSGYDVLKYLFVDDYNPLVAGRDWNVSLKDYVNLIKSKGYAPDRIIFESSMIEKADKVIDELIKLQKVFVDEKNGRYWLAKGGVDLKDGKKYSCAVLDSALTLHKFQNGDAVINVLPNTKENRSQQKNMANIVKQLGYQHERIIPHFYTTHKMHNDKYAEKDSVRQIMSFMCMVEMLSNNYSCYLGGVDSNKVWHDSKIDSVG